MSELKKLERLFTRGKISRREFLAGMSALGLSAAVSPVLLPEPALASEPKQGGRLRIGSQGHRIGDSIDPTEMDNMMTQSIFGQIRNCLVEINNKSEAIPELAESWESSPDAAKWIFKIRKGVEFHNGKTLDAEDVIFSLNHHLREDSKSPFKATLKPIKEIKKEDKHTIAFVLEAGNADFPVLMGSYKLQIVPNGTTDFEKGVGTGGYILVKREPGVSCLTKRNPNYWKEGRAHFDEVETLSIPDVNARTSALRSGRIDVMDRCDPRTVHLLAKVSGIQVLDYTSLKHYTIGMNTKMSPYDNNNVRLALKHAIDREELLKKILAGHGTIGNDHPISPINRYYASELPQRHYDPDKARYYLKKAGFDGHTFTLHPADAAYVGCVDSAILFQEQATKAGIKIKIVQEPSDGYWSNVWMVKESYFCYWWGNLSENYTFTITYSKNAPWNDTFWSNERFEHLLKATRSELDPTKRHEMYIEMQSIVRDQGGAIIPLFANNVEAATDKLKHKKLAGIEMDGHKLAERWWFGS